jgi:hypothetical protein
MEDHHWSGQGWNSAVEPEEEGGFFQITKTTVIVFVD